jgi:broad-specificity NMP kinase
LTGVPGVGSSTVDACAKLSSFTNQLVEAREARLERQRGGLGGSDEQDADDNDSNEAVTGGAGRVKGQLWNAVSHWALKGETDD